MKIEFEWHLTCLWMPKQTLCIYNWWRCSNCHISWNYDWIWQVKLSSCLCMNTFSQKFNIEPVKKKMYPSVLYIAWVRRKPLSSLSNPKLYHKLLFSISVGFLHIWRADWLGGERINTTSLGILRNSWGHPATIYSISSYQNLCFSTVTMWPCTTRRLSVARRSPA